VDLSPVLGEIAKVGAGVSAIDLSPVLAEIEQLKGRIGEDLPRTLQYLRENQGNIDFSPVLNEISNLTCRDLSESQGNIDFSPVLDEIAKLTVQDRQGNTDSSPVLGNTDFSPVFGEPAKLTAGINVDSKGDEGVQPVAGDAGVQQAMAEISRMRAELNRQQTELQDDVSSGIDEDKDNNRAGDFSPLQAEIGQLKADVLDAIEKIQGRSGADSRGDASLAEVTTQLSCIREDVASLLKETRSEMPSADGDLSAVLEDLRRVRETVETDLPRLFKELVENHQPCVEIKVDDSSMLDRVCVAVH